MSRAQHYLGIAKLQLGQAEQAITSFERAIRGGGPDSRALSDLGVALQSGGEVRRANDVYRAGIVCEPGYSKPYYNGARILFDCRKLDGALAGFRAATLIDPNYAEAWANRAATLILLDRRPAALAAYRISVALRPEAEVAYANLASVQKDLDLLPQSNISYIRALRLDASRPETHQNYGNYFEKSEIPDQAVNRYRLSICVDPAFPSAYTNLGTILQQLGDFAPSAAAYERAIAIAPRIGINYRQRCGILQVAVPSDFISRMEVLAGDASLGAEEKMQISFALGDLYERRKDYDRSFSHFLIGNTLKRASITYDNEHDLRSLKQVAAAFPAELIANFAGMGQASAQPVFVIGMPRSGSTLTEQILASHPGVYGAGERYEFSKIVKDLLRERSTDIISFAASMGGDDLRRIGDAYAEKMRSLAPEASRVTDKMPGNFLFAGLIHLALPNAKIIHCYRDPVDTCLSCFSKLFAEEQPWSHDLTELGRYYRAYEGLMAHWRSVLPAGVMLDVRYEDVVADVEGQARRIIDHCGLPWDPKCLTFYDTDRPVRTASAAQVRQPIYKGAIEKWRRYETHLAPLLDALQEPQGDTMAQIKIDDVTYEVDHLSEPAKHHVASLQFVDGEIQRLQLQLAMAQTARNTYFSALQEELKKTKAAGA